MKKGEEIKREGRKKERRNEVDIFRTALCEGFYFPFICILKSWWACYNVKQEHSATNKTVTFLSQSALPQRRCCNIFFFYFFYISFVLRTPGRTQGTPLLISLSDIPWLPRMLCSSCPCNFSTASTSNPPQFFLPSLFKNSVNPLQGFHRYFLATFSNIRSPSQP